MNKNHAKKGATAFSRSGRADQQWVATGQMTGPLTAATGPLGCGLRAVGVSISPSVGGR